MYTMFSQNQLDVNYSFYNFMHNVSICQSVHALLLPASYNSSLIDLLLLAVYVTGF